MKAVLYSQSIGSLYDLLCPEPHLYVGGEILRHRLPAEVEVRVHGVPGQEGGGPRLDHGSFAGSPKKLDTGQTLPFLSGSDGQSCFLFHRYIYKLEIKLTDFTFGVFQTGKMR